MKVHRTAHSSAAVYFFLLLAVFAGLPSASAQVR